MVNELGENIEWVGCMEITNAGEGSGMTDGFASHCLA